MNSADSRRLASALERLGYTPADHIEEADVVVLNTCVVRQAAEDKVYGRLSSLRPLKQRKPDVVIALMGCLVGLKDPAPLLHRFPWVNVFMPPSEPEPLLEYLAGRGLVDEARAVEAAAAARRCHLQDGDTDVLIPLIRVLPARERGRLVSAYVPVVLGCSHACTYCVIPYRRGPEHSRPPADILAEAQALAAQGVKEITLLGQIVDRYGLDLPPASGISSLADLLRHTHEIEGLQRIRFLTSHPNWMTDELLEAVAVLPKVCEHIEVPAQAGDDEVLARMQRGYTADDYRNLIARIRAHIPGVSIATDVIVGFPGETEAQFQRTYDLLAELRLDKAHIARYSPRPQTLATRHFPDDVPPEEKERRRKALDDLQARIVAEINARLLGETAEVLVEGKKKNRWWGRTRTDKLVFFEDQHPGDWHGQLAQVHITWTGPWSLIGEAGRR